ncbi:MAG TPA: cobalamin-dependent protein [Vicinamibacteria bacterium]
MTRDRLAVLVSEPQAFRQTPYLPYLWAILKSYGERAGGLEGRVRWLDPLYQKGDVAGLLDPHRGDPPDVFGMSCYTWNWDLQCDLAREVKARHPACLVVAGGPHPDYKDPAFFRKHPYVDAVAVKDGEITFSRILGTLLAGERDLGGVPGLYLPGNGDGHRHTGQAEVPVVFDHSPYVLQGAELERMARRHGAGLFDVVWETNRGCPYSCSFCDWGSSTMSKVRRFDMERVKAEIEWFSAMQVKSIILADANFGILERDLEIADLLNDWRARTGFPRYIHYSPAKNNPDRTVKIARKFVASGISPVHTFAVQHTDLGVLAATDRANISVDRQRQVAHAVVSEDIPTLVQLIVGIPGDTYSLWKGCLTDLMDWGLHDNYQIFNYTLLPNAPAAEKEFVARWGIETVTRQIPKEGTGQRDLQDTDALTKVDIVVRSRTFDREDWVRMKTYAAFVRTLHNRGLTRLVAQYLRFTHAVPYRAFYDLLIEEHFGRGPLYGRIAGHFRAFLSDAAAFEDLPCDVVPDHPRYFEASRWAFVMLCRQFDDQFDALSARVRAAFPDAGNLASALEYQRNLVVLPGYDAAAGKAFRTDLDWPGYFRQARLLTRYEPLGEPAPAPGATVLVSDDQPELRWADRDEGGRWLAWMERTREMQRTLSVNFEELRLVARPR